MPKFTIQDLAEGRCAVKNDGTLEQLREVLGKAFPNSPHKTNGIGISYYKLSIDGFWEGCNHTQLPTQSVKDFLEPSTVEPEQKRINVIHGNATDLKIGPSVVTDELRIGTIGTAQFRLPNGNELFFGTNQGRKVNSDQIHIGNTIESILSELRAKAEEMGLKVDVTFKGKGK